MLTCFLGAVAVNCLFLPQYIPAARTFPLSELYDITVRHHYITFLAPDAKLGERRYTLQMPSPAEAAVLERRLRRENCEETFQATCRLPWTSIARQQVALHLRHPLPGRFPITGHVVTEKDRVTFIGRSGIPHPMTLRLALLLTLIAYLSLIPFFWQVDLQFQLDHRSWATLTVVVPALLVFIFVYLPTSAILTHIFGKRVTLPRRCISCVESSGREVALTISYRIVPRILILAMENDSEATALAEELTHVQKR